MQQSAQTVTLVQLRMALACVVLAIVGGLLSVLHYIPSLSPGLAESGLAFQKLRPLHTTFASVWIFGAAIAVMYHYMAHDGGGLSRADMRRFWFHTACWITAGVGIVVTLAMGVFTGREYIGSHWALSAVLLLGWFALAFNFLRRSLRGFWTAPIYIWFWTTGVLYFIYTFVEGHAYLLPWVQEQPLRDIGLHWKSCGTLVGSFNFLVYGSLIYLSEKLSGDKRYGQSAIAFWLFGVGCLNSFTNFAHHTYHLPQSHLVKWIAFVVSMIEIVILLKLLSDIAKAVRSRGAPGPFHAVAGYLTSAKWWTTVMLTLSIVISVPNLNSLVHGTHMITGHAMGTELGIDSMVLFGGVTFLLAELHRGSPSIQTYLNDTRMRTHLVVTNLAMIALVGWLSVSGTVHGIYRYYAMPSPEWVSYGTYVFPITGGILAAALLYLVARWTPLLLGLGDLAAIEPSRGLEGGPAGDSPRPAQHPDA